MLTTTDILATIEAHETHTVTQLAKDLNIPAEQLETILNDLHDHELVQYNPQTGKVTLAPWLATINEEIEDAKPAAGTLILPTNQEITIQDITISNFTDQDLELHIRLTAKTKEIAISQP